MKTLGPDEENFSDTNGAMGIFDNDTMTCGGDATPIDMLEVGVYISANHSLVFNVTKLNGTPRLG